MLCFLKKDHYLTGFANIQARSLPKLPMLKVLPKLIQRAAAVAQSVDDPSKVLVWCNSSWVWITPRHKVAGKNPCSAIYCRNKSVVGNWWWKKVKTMSQVKTKILNQALRLNRLYYTPGKASLTLSRAPSPKNLGSLQLFSDARRTWQNF